MPKILSNYTSSNKYYTIKVRINDTMFSSFLKNKKTNKSNIILISDSYILHKAFWMNNKSFWDYNITIPISENSKFIIGIIDNLNGNNNLINIRKRSKFIITFNKFNEIKTTSHLKYQKKILIDHLEKIRLNIKKIENKNSTLYEINLKSNISFRKEIIKTRKKLRDIQHKLNKEVNLVKNYIKFFNIVFIPMIIFIYLFFNYYFLKKIYKNFI